MSDMHTSTLSTAQRLYHAQLPSITRVRPCLLLHFRSVFKGLTPNLGPVAEPPPTYAALSHPVVPTAFIPRPLFPQPHMPLGQSWREVVQQPMQPMQPIRAPRARVPSGRADCAIQTSPIPGLSAAQIKPVQVGG